MCLAVPGRVVEITRSAGLCTATVEVGGVARELVIDYVPDVQVGDYVVASLGFAVRRLTEDEARETYEALGQLYDLSGLDPPAAPTAGASDPPASEGDPTP
jgi:hydrogenase expression/formation protein HypC